GEAKGAKAGGVLQQPYFELTVLAKPRDIPEEITADVTELEIGDSLTVAELPKSPEFSYVDDEETAVVTVTAPEVEKEPVEGEDGIIRCKKRRSRRISLFRHNGIDNGLAVFGELPDTAYSVIFLCSYR